MSRIPRSQGTPAISPGNTYEFTVEIPSGCWEGGDCDFTITADSTDLVDESDEANNTASGACVG